MNNLKSEFHDQMINIYKLAKEESNYRPTAFLTMVAENGGLETAKKLLSTENMQSGLYELFECGRLDLTMETLVLNPKYRELFTEEEIKEARRRIDLLNRQE